MELVEAPVRIHDQPTNRVGQLQRRLRHRQPSENALGRSQAGLQIRRILPNFGIAVLTVLGKQRIHVFSVTRGLVG
ncbi:hypothetical protein CORMATOL_02444 [Corynebacterium matruchotii ATCC 33806]|uniref:Uncharacterized protein n=1 Tax=Corynebacterium matruchotii ATCC 33806 TaxID=566549 RepID=C0E612_9CORY|nr:hypothetical protein CORMATOL_02444 [Corynebacterium matruchotii ATCC 33806]